jgi:hypothetical protein
MKLKNIAVIASLLSLSAAANAQTITSFLNADFDSGIVTTPGPYKGFDAPDAPEISGWQNYGSITDAGVEASGAWWIQGYANQNCAFVNAGGGAYNLSTYTVQSGDIFTVSVVADAWGSGQITASLFYNDPANVIGSYTFTPNAWHFDTWTDATGITATGGSVGGTLGIIIANTGGADIVGFDEITVSVASVPEPATASLAAIAGFGLFLARRRSLK